MAGVLSKLFEKKEIRETWKVQDSETISIALAQEAYYRYLFKKDKDNDQALTIPQKLVIDVTTESLQKKEVRQKSVPRLPRVIPKLMQSLRDPESSAKDYVEIIDKDPVMASAVLKLANSAYFNPIGRRITQLEDAIVKLGISGLRTVLSAAVMQPIIQKESAYFSQSGYRIWLHSLFCAVACEIIAEHRKVEKFKVYILGLVHDIGKITLFSELCKQFKMNKEEVEPNYHAFAPPLKKYSPALSYWIAKDWNMPTEIVNALGEQLKLKQGTEVSTYGHILYQANMAAEIFAAIYPVNPKKAKKVIAELDLPDNLFETFERVVAEL